MNSKNKVLTDLVKACQMGMHGIDCVLPMAGGTELKQALKQQRKEYHSIYEDARNLARRQGCPVRELSGAVRGMSAMASKVQLMSGNRDSKIAGMMIQGNTRGMIQSLKNTSRWNDPEPQTAALAQRLLETEQNNIRQMEGFL